MGIELATPEEELEWGKKCQLISRMILDRQVKSDRLLIELIGNKLSHKELIICTHQYIMNRTTKIALEKLKVKENNDIIYG